MKKNSKLVIAFLLVSVISFVFPKNAEAYRVFNLLEPVNLCSGAQGNCLPTMTITATCEAD